MKWKKNQFGGRKVAGQAIVLACQLGTKSGRPALSNRLRLQCCIGCCWLCAGAEAADEPRCLDDEWRHRRVRGDRSRVVHEDGRRRRWKHGLGRDTPALDQPM